MKNIVDKLAFIKNLDYRKLMKNNWIKYGACSLASLIIIAIIFALPVKTVIVETTKPYFVNQTKYEPYSTMDYFITEETVQRSRMVVDGYYPVLPFGVIVPFQIDRTDSRLVGKFENTIPGSFVVYNSANRIVWETLNSSRGTIDLALPPGEYRAKFQENVMWGEQLYLNLNIKWKEIEKVTRNQEVTRYREVPIIVAQETKVVTENKLSIWQILFE